MCLRCLIGVAVKSRGSQNQPHDSGRHGGGLLGMIALVRGIDPAVELTEFDFLTLLTPHLLSPFEAQFLNEMYVHTSRQGSS